MSFTLNQLEIFVLVAQSGSFSAAARILGKAQSAVSTAVSNLEIELGLELFSRQAKYPVLTRAGRTFWEAAEAMLRQRRSLEELAGALSSGLESRLDIAIDGAVPVGLVRGALTALEAEYPQIRLNLADPGGQSALAMVEREEVDLALMPAASKYGPDISFRRLGDLVFVNVVGRGHPLSRLPVVNFSHLHSHRQLVYAPHVGALPTEGYLHAGRRWAFTGYGPLLACLRESLGWTSCPRHLVEEALAEGEVVELELEAYPETEWLVGLDLVWPAGKKSGVAAAWLKNCLVNAPKGDLVNTGRFFKSRVPLKSSGDLKKLKILE
ncbi:LysR family transcriptional regulator [Deltaproteobacteria bacterium OttesenSCG-928-K17]|nr:LysR family transcriptional regulator [Deltaproteobacteria bacterium OttesenSCG-928-K17]